LISRTRTLWSLKTNGPRRVQHHEPLQQQSDKETDT